MSLVDFSRSCISAPVDYQHGFFKNSGQQKIVLLHSGKPKLYFKKYNICSLVYSNLNKYFSKCYYVVEFSPSQLANHLVCQNQQRRPIDGQLKIHQIRDSTEHIKEVYFCFHLYSQTGSKKYINTSSPACLWIQLICISHKHGNEANVYTSRRAQISSLRRTKIPPRDTFNSLTRRSQKTTSVHTLEAACQRSVKKYSCLIFLTLDKNYSRNVTLIFRPNSD